MTLTPVFKLLSDETRLRIILLLAKEELCVCEICGILDEPQPKVSKVLSKLRDLNLVSDRRIEKFVFYSVKDTNELLNHILLYILKILDDYPQLVIDQQRLTNKTDYMDHSALESLRELS
jgi:ArsR family transcriptional regulator